MIHFFFIGDGFMDLIGDFSVLFLSKKNATFFFKETNTFFEQRYLFIGFSGLSRHKKNGGDYSSYAAIVALHNPSTAQLSRASC